MKKIITIFLALFCFQAAFAQYRDDYADIKDKSYKEQPSLRLPHLLTWSILGIA